LGDDDKVPANGMGAYKKKRLVPIAGTTYLCNDFFDLVRVQSSWEGFGSLCSIDVLEIGGCRRVVVGGCWCMDVLSIPIAGMRCVCDGFVDVISI
jgi:hypothetical protein